MGYNNESRKTKSIDNRNRIVEAALRLIDEKGFDNVTVSQITEAAGVSKGAFYIHFKSKEELIEQQISESYDEFKLDPGLPKFERLSYFLLNSIKVIKDTGLKMCQEWFSHSVKGNYFGQRKLAYDTQAVREIVMDETFAEEIIAVYYGSLNLWCFTDGITSPEGAVNHYLDNVKERLS